MLPPHGHGKQHSGLHADIIAQSNDVDPGARKFAPNIARAFREPVEQPVGDAVAVNEVLEEVVHTADIPGGFEGVALEIHMGDLAAGVNLSHTWPDGGIVRRVGGVGPGQLRQLRHTRDLLEWMEHGAEVIGSAHLLGGRCDMRDTARAKLDIGGELATEIVECGEPARRVLIEADPLEATEVGLECQLRTAHAGALFN